MVELPGRTAYDSLASHTGASLEERVKTTTLVPEVHVNVVPSEDLDRAPYVRAGFPTPNGGVHPVSSSPVLVYSIADPS